MFLFLSAWKNTRTEVPPTTSPRRNTTIEEEQEVLNPSMEELWGGWRREGIGQGGFWGFWRIGAFNKRNDCIHLGTSRI